MFESSTYNHHLFLISTEVRAYLKPVMCVAYGRNGPLAFGTGSITDGIHKLNVRVSTFKTEDSANHAKGLRAMITGTVSCSGIFFYNFYRFFIHISLNDR